MSKGLEDDATTGNDAALSGMIDVWNVVDVATVVVVGIVWDGGGRREESKEQPPLPGTRRGHSRVTRGTVS